MDLRRSKTKLFLESLFVKGEVISHGWDLRGARQVIR